MLKVNNIKYKYKNENKENIYNFSLEAKCAEVVGILGASGNGKSTLLDLISGFLSSISGDITYNDQDITDLAPEKRPITILFQNYNLFEHLNVEKNILLGIESKNKQEDIKKTYKILSEIGLKGYEKKIASSLSGGEQQRVALARALLRNKPILLLDEPFTGLDFDTREHMLHLVKTITKTKQICTIMVTHEPNDCKKIANKIYEVKNGKLTLL
ncbi:MAG: ATP-binding cassette domain-containing protein [Epsilonproteobacteria bacterium]|nr:ATP-binding cassette domain-containing protein [Campylobacterota bacterium]